MQGSIIFSSFTGLSSIATYILQFIFSVILTSDCRGLHSFEGGAVGYNREMAGRGGKLPFETCNLAGAAFNNTETQGVGDG